MGVPCTPVTLYNIVVLEDHPCSHCHISGWLRDLLANLITINPSTTRLSGRDNQQIQHKVGLSRYVRTQDFHLFLTK